MPRSRQLAAIMFTDIQGYTALMQHNEEKAIQARDKHRDIFNSTTAKYKGKILQYYGDGTLSIFDSAIDAVKCGVEMQLGFQQVPALSVRIGIHTGDIVFSEEEIIGDSVNVASRIESLAVPGSVFISDKVYDEIKNQKSIQTTFLKTFHLKNVERPIGVYAIANEGLIVPDADEVTGKTTPTPATGTGQQGGDYNLGSSSNASTQILATKLYVPPLRPTAVLRPRLIDRLNRGVHAKLSLVSASAGFGKTTIVSEWVAGQERSIAWLSLDERDIDPVRFWTYFMAAIQTILPTVGERMLQLMQSPQPPPIESLLVSMVNEIAHLPAPFIVVLDDYHLIESPAIDEALAFLLDHQPPQMHLVIATREDPNLPLARLRVRGQLTELRAVDLRFTTDEVVDFLNKETGLDLAVEDIQILETRTEGWIAGLQLAALSIQGRTDAAEFIQAFAGDNRYVLDYLIEEVLQRQPLAIRAFLLQTSILDRLSASLCDAVADTTEGKQLLETMERGNLFVIPLDDKRQWFRYHHLFADVLQARSMEEQAEQLPILHGRASEWYEQHGFSAEAIIHALKAKDFERAAGLLELVWPAMDAKFQSIAWLKWATQLPDHFPPVRPVLGMAYAWAHLNLGNMEAAHAYLINVERWLDESKTRVEPSDEMVVVDQEEFKFLPANLAGARGYQAQSSGDIESAIQYCQKAIDLLPDDEYLRRIPAIALLGLTQWGKGELEAAYWAISDAMDDFWKSGFIVFAISGTYGMADIRIAQGRLQDAIQVCNRALQVVEDHGEPWLKGAADIYLGLGRIALEQGDIELARQHIAKSGELGEFLGVPDWPHRFPIVVARLKEVEGDYEGALVSLEEAEKRFYRSPMPIYRPVEAIKLRIKLRQGRVSKAMAWAQREGLSVDDELSYLKEFEHITLARTLIAHYHSSQINTSLEQAIQLLERLLKAAEDGARNASVVEILILLALAHEAKGDDTAAVTLVKRALELAEPQGYVQLFVDEGAPIQKVLGLAAAQGLAPVYVKRLLAAFDPSSQEPGSQQKTTRPTVSPAVLVEPLSERELEILHLIAEGLSNQAISQRLFLALSTIKGHNQNIFAKLDVQRRTEAVAKARELGLL